MAKITRMMIKILPAMRFMAFFMILGIPCGLRGFSESE
jgi:hypothetical protein